MTRYVVYWEEQLRDGMESGCEIVNTLEEASVLIDKIANGFVGCNTSFCLFKLGEQIHLKFDKVEEVEQQVKTTVKVKIG
jgi:hypothetical protein